jgi:hypothetical protein
LRYAAILLGEAAVEMMIKAPAMTERLLWE